MKCKPPFGVSLRVESNHVAYLVDVGRDKGRVGDPSGSVRGEILRSPSNKSQDLTDLGAVLRAFIPLGATHRGFGI